MSDPTPDWYPDPTGRHQVRYWDGARWTEHVATGGVQATDALPAPSAAADLAVGHARGPLPLLAATLALAAFAVAMWFAWLGWDQEYYYVDGYPQGPYRAWQVIGCGLSIAVGAVLAYLWVRRTAAIFLLSAVATIAFAIPWSAYASSTDDSGLWAVGLLFLLVGGVGGLVAVLAVTDAFVRSRGSKRPRSHVSAT